MSEPVEPTNHRILIIDDNASIHEDLKKILLQETQFHTEFLRAENILFNEAPEAGKINVTYTIDSAFQGAEGLDRVQQSLDEDNPYALAFVDIRMPPGWDGLETVSRIWKIYPQLQIVICTAYSDYSWCDMVNILGSSENLMVLKKPFDSIEALQLAHGLTKKWSLDRQVQQRNQELVSANENLQMEVDERRRTQDALKQSENRFRKAFEASPIAIAIQSVDSLEYVDVNNTFLKLTGFERSQVLGKTPSALGLYGKETSAAQVLSLFEQEREVRNEACQITAQSKETKQCLLSLDHFEQNDETYFLVLLQDVSELTHLEEELQQAQKMEAIGQLAAGVAHDFNNILTIIQGHVHLRLIEEDLEDKIQKSLQQVSGAADRAAGLTRQLLAFSRKQVIRLRPVDLSQLIQNVSPLLGRLLGENIQLNLESGPDLPMIHADPCNVEQIIFNLCVNARDAMSEEGGPISIRTQEITIDEDYARHHGEAVPGRYLCLSVIDSGVGMDAATRSRVFEPFFTTKEAGKGTGMGLATVQGIARQHKGWVELDSQPGVGSTFRVYLPVSEEAQSQERAGDDDAQRLQDDCTVLYVEDEPMLRTMMTEVLGHYGYQVIAVENGQQALDLWKVHKNQVDVVLTDIVMPGGISGRDLAERFLKEDPDLKVVYTSGYSEELFGYGIELQEGQNYLPKPYTPSTVTSILARSMAESRPAA